MADRLKVPDLKGVMQGAFGLTITITLTDYDGIVQDISAFDGTKTVYARHKDTGTEVSATASFTSDGTDGKLSFSWDDGDIAYSGEWIYQAVLLDSGSSMKGKTVPAVMDVEEAIDG